MFTVDVLDVSFEDLTIWYLPLLAKMDLIINYCQAFTQVNIICFVWVTLYNFLWLHKNIFIISNVNIIIIPFVAGGPTCFGIKPHNRLFSLNSFRWFNNLESILSIIFFYSTLFFFLHMPSSRWVKEASMAFWGLTLPQKETQGRLNLNFILDLFSRIQISIFVD